MEELDWFVGGAVASWLVRSSPDRAVRVQALARGHCVVFLGKTLNSHGASLHPGVIILALITQHKDGLNNYSRTRSTQKISITLCRSLRVTFFWLFIDFEEGFWKHNSLTFPWPWKKLFSIPPDFSVTVTSLYKHCLGSTCTWTVPHVYKTMSFKKTPFRISSKI